MPKEIEPNRGWQTDGAAGCNAFGGKASVCCTFRSAESLAPFPRQQRAGKGAGGSEMGNFRFLSNDDYAPAGGRKKMVAIAHKARPRRSIKRKRCVAKAKGCKSVAAREGHVKVTFSIFYPKEGPQRECVTGDGANVSHGGWWVYRAHGAVINYLR